MIGTGEEKTCSREGEVVGVNGVCSGWFSRGPHSILSTCCVISGSLCFSFPTCHQGQPQGVLNCHGEALFFLPLITRPYVLVLPAHLLQHVSSGPCQPIVCLRWTGGWRPDNPPPPAFGCVTSREPQIYLLLFTHLSQGPQPEVLWAADPIRHTA